MEKSAKSKQQQQVNTGKTRYERDMAKSFAVIYHNLKRLREDKQNEHKRVRRSLSEPQIPALTQTEHQPIGNRRRSDSIATRSAGTTDYKRRVSFCDSLK